MTDVIILNGGSSSGKTTIAVLLQGILPGTWLRFGVDTLVDALPLSLQEGLLGADGIVNPDTGEFRRAEQAFMCGIATMVDRGARIILDEVFLGGRYSADRWREALGDASILWVGVRCEGAVADARERARADRISGMARDQAVRVHEGMRYDVEVDSTATPAGLLARVIARAVES